MADIYNLTLYFCARRMAHQMLQRQGADFFALPEPDGPAFRLDQDKIEWVVNSAVRAARDAAPDVPTSAHDISLCRTKLHGELLRHFVVNHTNKP